MSVPNLPRGPLMIDIAGPRLTERERGRLADPRVGGLILFARNYVSPEQLAELAAEVHALRSPPILIAIDHEGGRVQRCREGFTRLPPMRRLGERWERDPHGALALAREIGYTLASELRRRGVDLSFTPVLDLDRGRSAVIGDRAFHRDPGVVVQLAGRLIDGLRAAGMGACGKHFPGHGWAEADSHVALPVDDRPPAEIAEDMRPFRELPLDAIMPAHVIYSRVDSRPAGFSPVWLAKLREEMGFDGVIFSDDLSMEAASVAGGVVERLDAAWNAGCDMLLLCNAPDKVDEALANWRPDFDARRAARVARLLPSAPEYHFFYRSPLGQWNRESFQGGGFRFCCAEQYMMYWKARLFGDDEAARQILAETEPRRHQALGRQVKGFDPAVWSHFREAIVFAGNVLKFSQNEPLRALLMATGGKPLVEASPTDRIWGIGLAEDDPRRLDERNWKGMNLLGKALTRAREYLKRPDAAPEEIARTLAAQIEEGRGNSPCGPLPGLFDLDYPCA